MNKVNIKNLLIELISNKQSFACWKIPGKKLKLITGGWQKIDSLDDVIDKKGFYIQSFDNKIKLFLVPDARLQNKIIFKKKDNIYRTTQAQYLSVCRDYIHKVQSGVFNKLVLSRTSVLKNISTKQIADLYYNALTQYKNAFVYIVNIPGYTTWMGASPEILVSTRKQVLTTVSLAGTKKHHNPLTYNWQHKEIQEQALVTEYINKVLKHCGLNKITQGKTKTVKAGKLLHIKTVFKAYFENTGQLTKVIEQLHPTPAVCGIPKQQAFDYIIKTEKHNRELYTGFIGPIENNEITFYVNLRCLKYKQNSVTFYAGGGITNHSDPKGEWYETENKINVLKELLKSKKN